MPATPDITVKEGDTSPPVEATLKDGKNKAVPLRDGVDQVSFRMKLVGLDEAGEERPQVELPATIVDGGKGIVQYQWQPGDLEVVGVYETDFLVLFGDGTQVSFPNDGSLILQVLEAGDPLFAVSAATGPSSNGSGAVGPPGPPGPPGPEGPQGPAGGVVTDGWWNYDPATAAPPLNGQVRTSPATTAVGDTITMYLHATDSDGLYWQVDTPPVPGDELELRGTFRAVQRITITSFDLTVAGAAGYATFVGTVTAANMQIAKSALVEVSLIRHASGGGGGVMDAPVSGTFLQFNTSDYMSFDNDGSGALNIDANGGGDINLYAAAGSINAQAANGFVMDTRSDSGFDIESKGSGNIALRCSADGDITLQADGGRVRISGPLVTMPGLPTTDPHVSGALWNSGGTLMISAG